MSCEPVFEEIHSLCQVSRSSVVLTLQCASRSLADVVLDVPVYCSCSRGVKCLLKAQCIMSNRIKTEMSFEKPKSKEQKLVELDALIKRYNSDLVCLVDRLEVFFDEKSSPIYHKIADDYKVAAEALLEAKAEWQLLGLLLTEAQQKALRRISL